MFAFVLLLATQTSLIVPAQISKPGESKPMDWRKLLTKETFQANGMSLPYRLLRPAKEEKEKKIEKAMSRLPAEIRLHNKPYARL